MIWIIGGTTETRQLVELLNAQAIEYLVTVATDSGRAMLPEETPVLVARLDAAAMQALLRTHAITAVADVSHPYAAAVSANARQACKLCQIPYFRYVRPQTEIRGARWAASLEDCLNMLKTLTGGVFFTTGSTQVREFEQVRGSNRFVYRVLPTPESIAECLRQGVLRRDVVALMGPVSVALNVALFAEYQAAYVVMKNSGQAGGTPEKLRACEQLGITPIIIGRPPDAGISDLQGLMERLVKKERL
jgi:precorrin-6A/cobalt-precorrin-6A reductase